jgi:hypothetical protein
MGLSYKINKLSAQEISELQTDKALRIIEENANTLADIEAELFDEIERLGTARIKVEQLKSLKSAIVEMNRALGVVVKNG